MAEGYLQTVTHSYQRDASSAYTDRTVQQAVQRRLRLISGDGGGKDAFVHATTLNRAGIPELTGGQRVAMTIVEGRKGLEVASLRLV